MKPIISIIVTIAVVVGIITLMNLGLHYGQDLWHKEDNERLDVLKEEIQSLRARMDTLHGVIEIVESPSQSDVDRYNEMVDKLLFTFSTLFGSISSMVTSLFCAKSTANDIPT